ncbi:MAG TPA: type II secretion system F family protein [Tepidisphaeraceae bacterium]|jgi:type II secretory pathway component PulF|nr:type II secretion system F family protein [Tepidisphaeraceae bacterium]
MATFRYQTIDSGKPSAGVLQAATLDAAAEALHARGRVIVDLVPAETSIVRRPLHAPTFSPGTRDVANFTAQLAVMIRAGISVRAAIEGIGEQVTHPRFKSMLVQMRKDIENGLSFSDALARYPKTFSPLYINMVKASEMSGGFPAMLARIAGYLNQQLETRGLIVGAMTYPAIIAMMAVTTTIFLLMFVLPRFLVLFAGKESALPASTKMLMALSAFLVSYWYALAIVLSAGIWALALILRTETGRAHFDRLKLTLPLVCKMFRALYISRGLHTMGQLVNAGVPILDTIAITAEVSGNVLYRQMWRTVYGAVKEGKRIAIPLQKSTLLPRAVVQMINAGEEAGRLGQVLDEVSEYYSRELKTVIKTVTSLIEPAMILIMGGIVGFIAASIILPIFKLSQIMAR